MTAENKGQNLLTNMPTKILEEIAQPLGSTERSHIRTLNTESYIGTTELSLRDEAFYLRELGISNNTADSIITNSTVSPGTSLHISPRSRVIQLHALYMVLNALHQDRNPTQPLHPSQGSLPHRRRRDPSPLLPLFHRFSRDEQTRQEIIEEAVELSIKKPEISVYFIQSNFLRARLNPFEKLDLRSAPPPSRVNKLLNFVRMPFISLWTLLTSGYVFFILAATLGIGYFLTFSPAGLVITPYLLGVFFQTLGDPLMSSSSRGRLMGGGAKSLHTAILHRILFPIIYIVFLAKILYLYTKIGSSYLTLEFQKKLLQDTFERPLLDTVTFLKKIGTTPTVASRANDIIEQRTKRLEKFTTQQEEKRKKSTASSIQTITADLGGSVAIEMASVADSKTDTTSNTSDIRLRHRPSGNYLDRQVEHSDSDSERQPLLDDSQGHSL